MGKRLIVIVLSVVMAVIPCCVSVSADDSEYSEWRTSEELHEERLRLMDYYENNKSQIEAIDEELEKRGEEVISEEELHNKILNSNRNQGKDVPSLAYDPGYVSGVRWTSKRYNQVYAGQVYEIQEILGESTDSETSKLCKTETKTSQKTGSFKAGSTTIWKFTAQSLVTAILDSAAPGFGTGISLFTLLSSYDKNITTSSSLKYICLSYIVSIYVNEKFVFVKRLGESDNSQILCYVGNNIRSSVTVVYPRYTYSNGVVVEVQNSSKTYAGNNLNENYKSLGNEAAKNFYNYKNNNKSFNEFAYLITKCFYTTIEGSTSINIPYVAA